MKMTRRMLDFIEKVLVKRNGWIFIPSSDIRFLYVDIHIHRGKERKLGDGTVIKRGDLVGEFHVNNRNMPDVSLKNLKWFDRRIGDELALLSKALELEGFRECKAFYGRTILYPFVRKHGFEIYDVEGKVRETLIRLWDHLLYKAYTDRKSGRLRTTREVWISRERLEEMKDTGGYS